MNVDKPDTAAGLDYFEAFFALIPDLAAVTAPRGLFKRVNPAWERTLGYTSEELLDLPFTEFVHPDDLESTLSELSKNFTGRTTTGFVNRYRCRDGSYKWIEWDAVPAPGNEVLFATGRDITERKRAQEKLEDQDRQLSTIYNSVSDALFLLAVEPGNQFRFLSVNRRFLELTGLQESQVIGRYIHNVIPEPSIQTVLRHYTEAVAQKIEVRWEEMSDYPAGTRYAEVNISPIHDESGRCTNVVGTVRDLTERAQALLEKTRLEEQLRQSQKLESIGRLAGGVAHDFNNLLTVIRGYSDCLLNSLAPEDPLQAYVMNIGRAGESAANLTRQLLAFSRKQVIERRPLNLNHVVIETRSMLRSLIAEDVALVTRLDPRIGQVMADPDQIRQVLMNLAANARDAMPDGGELIIETSEVTIDENYVRTHPESNEGDFVLLTVRDTGVGMDAMTLRNVFEPFFTTKEMGKGTGLGLATVHGIVHQFKGWIELESAPGRGAQFRIYLPRLEGEPEAADGVEAPLATFIESGSGTILLVEDEQTVRELAAHVLISAGYSVISASSGSEAIEMAGKYAGQIDLMVTDVVMPGMNGRELADHFKTIRPGMKVLFTSGYTADVIVHRGVTDSTLAFLAKPFTPVLLAQKVRETLLMPEPPADSF